MNPDRTRIYFTCDKTIEYLLYTLVFFIPTSKSVVEVFATLAIMMWFYKKGLKAWEWAVEKKKYFVPPKSGFYLLKILAPLAIAAIFLTYSSIIISMAVISRHFAIEGALFSTRIFILITLFALLLIAMFLIITLAVVKSDFGLSLKASVLAFIIISLVTSSFTTQRLSISAEAFLFKTMEYLLIFLVMADVINTPRRIFNLITSLLIAAFFVGLDGIYQRSTGYDLFRKFPLFETTKVTASFKAPNGLGAYLATVLPLPLALVAFNVTNWKKTCGLLTLSLILAACLLLTFTRGAWLAFLAGYIFLFIFAGWRRFIVALVVLALLVSMTIAFTPTVIKGQLSSSIKIGSDLSSKDRILIWKTGWKMFLDRPVFGQGLNTFMSVFEKYKPADYKEIVYAHNCFLQMAAETGIIGLLIFLWFCASVISGALSKFFSTSDRLMRATAIGAAGCILAFFANSLVDTILYSLPLAVLFWSLCGLAAARTQPE